MYIKHVPMVELLGYNQKQLNYLANHYSRHHIKRDANTFQPYIVIDGYRYDTENLEDVGVHPMREIPGSVDVS